MDDIDLKLLALLQHDAKQKYADLAEVLNLSAPSVHARVKKMETSGIIEKLRRKAGFVQDWTKALRFCAGDDRGHRLRARQVPASLQRNRGSLLGSR